MHYAGARYYMSALGRWNGVDPANQHPNPYAYAGNNPVLNYDPDGLWYRCGGATWCAEEGDTFETFTDDTGYSESTARAYFRQNDLGDYSEADDDGNYEVVEAGRTLSPPGLDNAMWETVDVLSLFTGIGGLVRSGFTIAKLGVRKGAQTADKAVARILAALLEGKINSAQTIGALKAAARDISLNASGKTVNITLDHGTARKLAESLAGRSLKTPPSGATSRYLHGVKVKDLPGKVDINVYPSSSSGGTPLIKIKIKGQPDIAIRLPNY